MSLLFHNFNFSTVENQSRENECPSRGKGAGWESDLGRRDKGAGCSLVHHLSYRI
jgi:hypothetical protein